MTNTSNPVRRETLSSVRERGKLRPIVIELRSTYARLRLKGTRRTVTVTYDQLWTLGNRNAADERRRERLAARKVKKADA
jgi:hypothetical protein